MSPIQQMLLGVGAGATKTYIDDVFSTYLYEGNETARTINNGVDTTKGAMVWVKNRDNSSFPPYLYDTNRGTNKQLRSSSNAAETSGSNTLTAFNNNGISLGTDTMINRNNDSHVAWTFRKSPAFTICTWDGNGTAGRVISHGLKSVPGLIMIKSTTHATAWFTFHRDLGAEKYLILNETNAEADQTWFMNDTAPTSTGFSVGSSTNVNGSGRSYVAYLFAGGKGTTDKAVDFDGSGDYLSLPATTDLNLTGDFTIEFWVYPRSQSTSRQSILQTNRSWGAKYAVVQIQNGTQSGLAKKAQIWDYDMNNGYAIAYSNADIEEDEWTHIAFTRESGTIKIWINGKLDKTTTGLSDSIEFGDTSSFIGNHSNSYYLNAKLSNLRIVKGQALYTTNFNVPPDPLTTTSQGAIATNVKLLCCNGSTTTASTVTPGTITANGDPAVTTNNSIFDDAAANVFGDAGDQSVIKCGSYVGNGSDSDPVGVYLGFEPQFLLIKRTDTTSNWQLIDSMRGFPVDGNNWSTLRANTSAAETDSYTTGAEPTATGFNLVHSWTDVNASGGSYIFTAIRRPDGYVGKPRTATELFAIDTGNASSTIPTFDSGFPVDYTFVRPINITTNWGTYSRLTGEKFLRLNTTDAQGTYGGGKWDSNVGFGAESYWGSTSVAWMWKRHAGFDVVAGLKEFNSHNLGKIPEMVWIKRRDNTSDWFVWHKGLNGGTNDGLGYNLRLNTSAPENSTPSLCPIGDQLPTATHFKTASDSDIRNAGSIAFLFVSVDGISKVGSYTGTPNQERGVDCGFVPRFIIIKQINSSSDWFVFDTIRGINSTYQQGDHKLALNSSAAQNSSTDYLILTSSGFRLQGGNLSGTGNSYLFYAHA